MCLRNEYAPYKSIADASKDPVVWKMLRIRINPKQVSSPYGIFTKERWLEYQLRCTVQYFQRIPGGERGGGGREGDREWRGDTGHRSVLPSPTPRRVEDEGDMNKP